LVVPEAQRGGQRLDALLPGGIGLAPVIVGGSRPGPQQRDGDAELRAGLVLEGDVFPLFLRHERVLGDLRQITFSISRKAAGVPSSATAAAAARNLSQLPRLARVLVVRCEWVELTTAAQPRAPMASVISWRVAPASLSRKATSMRWASALRLRVPENVAGTMQLPSLGPASCPVSRMASSDQVSDRTSVQGVVWV
jgi:hypothetical protein